MKVFIQEHLLYDCPLPSLGPSSPPFFIVRPLRHLHLLIFDLIVTYKVFVSKPLRIIKDRKNDNVQGVQEKLCFSTIHCNPSLAYIAVRDLQSTQRNASVQSLLLAGNFLYNQ